MKKYLLLVSLVLVGFLANSQDLNTIRNMIVLNQFDKAKPEIDNYLKVEKNAAKAEGWYYKAYVYYSLGKVASKTVDESNALLQEAFESLKKYAEIDSKVPLTKEENNATIFNMYYTYYDLGAKSYNEKNYPQSFECFKKTLELHDYIVQKNISGPNNLKLPVHDTDVVWNLAVLANEIKKKDEAFVYYKKIADLDLGDERYAVAYDELVLKYKKEKNAEQFAKYLAAAKKHYPIDLPYWENKEIEFAIDGLEGEALLNKYEELTQKLPNNYVVFYNYAIETDKFIGSDAAKGKDINAYKKKIEELFKKAVSIKSTLEANLQLANLYYAKTYDLQERIAKIKGTKPEEVKVKNELIAQSKSYMNATIPYAEEAVKQLGELKEYKYSDKANYKLALEILNHAYKSVGNTAKLAEVVKKQAAVEKL
jgi:hypothetical protein